MTRRSPFLRLSVPFAALSIPLIAALLSWRTTNGPLQLLIPGIAAVCSGVVLLWYERPTGWREGIWKCLPSSLMFGIAVYVSGCVRASCMNFLTFSDHAWRVSLLLPLALLTSMQATTIYRAVARGRFPALPAGSDKVLPR